MGLMDRGGGGLDSIHSAGRKFFFSKLQAQTFKRPSLIRTLELEQRFGIYSSLSRDIARLPEVRPICDLFSALLDPSAINRFDIRYGSISNLNPNLNNQILDFEPCGFVSFRHPITKETIYEYLTLRSKSNGSYLSVDLHVPSDHFGLLITARDGAPMDLSLMATLTTSIPRHHENQYGNFARVGGKPLFGSEKSEQFVTVSTAHKAVSDQFVSSPYRQKLAKIYARADEQFKLSVIDKLADGVVIVSNETLDSMEKGQVPTLRSVSSIYPSVKPNLTGYAPTGDIRDVIHNLKKSSPGGDILTAVFEPVTGVGFGKRSFSTYSLKSSSFKRQGSRSFEKARENL